MRGTMRKSIGRYYDVKFISGDKSIEITVNSIGKEMSLHEIRLELYNDYNSISKLEIVTTGFLKGEEILNE